MTDLIRRQQDIIDGEMRTIAPETVDEVLADMKPDEANRFLERLGHLRARDVHDRLSEGE